MKKGLFALLYAAYGEEKAMQKAAGRVSRTQLDLWAVQLRAQHQAPNAQPCS